MRRADSFFSRGPWRLTIGLTGGIGSGKTTVGQLLADLGAPIIDADKVGHAIYAPGASAYAELVAAFGDGILAPDRTVDRQRLGAIVFSDSDALRRLNAIVHPKMYARMREMVDAQRAAGERKPIVIEAAVLVEANWMPLFDEIWLVEAGAEQVVARVERQRGLQREQIEARMRAQLSDAERRKHATAVIRNDGTIDELRARVTELWQSALAQCET